MANDRSPSSRTALIVGAIFAIWAVSISGIFGNSGVIQAYHLAEVRRDMRLRIAALTSEKVQLATQLTGLKGDPYVQERAIRETLGFARPNELVFDVPDSP